MQRFLKNIRKELAADNKPKKYLRYAIGEILLVVIGILIALQLTDWNEDRKSGIAETKLLLELKENIRTNIDLLNSQLNDHQAGIRSNQILMEVIKNIKAYDDSLAFHFHIATIILPSNLSFAAFEELKSSGFDILRSDQLRREIIQLYDETYRDMILKLSENVNAAGNAYIPYMISHFERLPGAGAVPNNFEQLLGDQKFINILQIINNLQLWAIQLKEDCIKESDRVTNLIDNELKKKKHSEGP